MLNMMQKMPFYNSNFLLALALWLDLFCYCKKVPLVIKDKANETVSSLLLDIFDCRSFAFNLLNLNLMSKFDKDDVTLFVPTNRAFDQMVLRDIRESKKNDSGYWQNILMGHAVQGKIHRKQIADGKQMKTLNGKTSLNPTGDGEAHLISGNNVTVRFLMEDIQAKNGIIHVITHIIVPPYANKPDKSKSILDNLAALGIKEFRNYVHEGDLLIREYLSGNKPVTVTLFVPTDEAFANIDLCTTLKLRLKPWIMRQLIQCHAMQGSYDLQDVKEGMQAEVPTLANPGTFGARVVVSRRNGSLHLGGGISVVKENVATSNGIVHLIDDVLCAPNSSKIVLNRTRNMTADVLERVGSLYKIAGMAKKGAKLTKKRSQFRIGGGSGGGKKADAKLAKDSSAKHSAKEHVKNAVSLAKMLRRRTDQERDERERRASRMFGQDLGNDYFYEREDNDDDEGDDYDGADGGDDEYDAKDQKLVFRDGVLVSH